ncbi:small cell adhesion glycoprotein [Ursus americanus]|uniref:small cell adhesion glycoprotein n=1 Tax=Ursus americanus TaxID=9643 RepID=UPI001E67CC10|nr:small cell adhesion glycoprotein [Ursus americanus]
MAELRGRVGRSLHPPSRPASAARSARPSRFLPLRGPCRRISAVPAPGEFKRTRGAAPGPPPAARPTGKVSTRRRAPEQGTGEGGRARRARGPHAHRGRLGHGSDASPERPEPPVAAARSGLPRTDGRTAARRRLPREPCADLLLPGGAHPLAAMPSLLTTPSPGEELMTTPVLQTTEALSPEAEASTALIAVVITVVFLTLLSVAVLIFFYLYKNKGSYVTYEPAEGEPGAVLQMESDSAKGRDKEEYFI